MISPFPPCQVTVECLVVYFKCSPRLGRDVRSPTSSVGSPAVPCDSTAQFSVLPCRLCDCPAQLCALLLYRATAQCSAVLLCCATPQCSSVLHHWLCATLPARPPELVTGPVVTVNNDRHTGGEKKPSDELPSRREIPGTDVTSAPERCSGYRPGK